MTPIVKSALKVILIVGMLGFISWLCWLVALPDVEASRKWRDRTVPMDSEMAFELCMVLGISDEDPLCDPNRVTYGPEFYKHIDDFLLPDDQLPKSYRQVLENFESYLICDFSEVSTDKIPSRCWLEFADDDQFPYAIRFDEQGFVSSTKYELGMP